MDIKDEFHVLKLIGAELLDNDKVYMYFWKNCCWTYDTYKNWIDWDVERDFGCLHLQHISIKIYLKQVVSPIIAWS